MLQTKDPGMGSAGTQAPSAFFTCWLRKVMKYQEISISRGPPSV